MKFCQLVNYPEAHLRTLNSASDVPYKERTDELVADPPDAMTSWVPSLHDSGHKAHLIVANDPISQHRWATEKLPGSRPGDREVVIEQLRKFKVDVLCIFDPVAFDTSFITALKGRPRWVIGHSSSLTTGKVDWSGFDLVLSPHEACVQQAWRWGAREARLFPWAFPREMAEAVFQVPGMLDVVYCGQWQPDAPERNRIIAALAEASVRPERPLSLALHLEVPHGVALPPVVEQANRGALRGIERYRALHSAAICVAEAADEPLGNAVSATVFEGTGTGVFTLAPENPALPAYFKPGTEVVTYQGEADLMAKIETYLAAEDDREAIAKAGQERCLTEHSMEVRLKNLAQLLEKEPQGLGRSLRRWRQRLSVA